SSASANRRPFRRPQPSATPSSTRSAYGCRSLPLPRTECSQLSPRREGIPNMKNFTYYRPKTAEDAVGLLDSKWGATEVLAGGTDLLDLQKEYVAQPDKVISISAISGLADIQEARSAYVIGAGTKLAAIAEHADLRKRFPALTTPAGDIGGP